MIKIHSIILGVKHFINYLYYCNSLLEKNIYPCKLIGEKLSSTSEIIVSYRVSGVKDVHQMHLKKLLNKKNLISYFHPSDAIKLGSLAFDNIISNLPTDKRMEKFLEIKDIMLNSIHDLFSPGQHYISSEKNPDFLDSPDEPNYGDLLIIKNKYPCKLVGNRRNISTGNKTVILYTILGKRDGHEKSLSVIIADKKLLSYFHPTEAIKFGFVSAGEKYFSA